MRQQATQAKQDAERDSAAVRQAAAKAARDAHETAQREAAAARQQATQAKQDAERDAATSSKAAQVEGHTLVEGAEA